uniref:tudor domain-containing protein 6 n=1 Tax=Euleptes europaea TaxID=460621 RepID=UPI0025401DF6|nr:tudor domain-containing protein 6 [Euleptes europaea]
MCSVLPTPGTSIKLRVSFVEVQAETPLARLWGLSGEWRELYGRLRDELQAAPGPRLANAPGGAGGAGAASGLAVGDLGLVELGGRWLRCRVVGRLRGPGQEYRVFLLDEGRTVSAGAYYLARGREDFFQLPSEVLGCILADLVPPGHFAAQAAGEPQALAPQRGGGRLSFAWTAGAVEFLGCLHGKEVSGLVREVLIPQRLVVLELPWLLAQMHHLGLASQISPAAFRTLLNASLGCNPAPPQQSSVPPPLPPPPLPQVPSPAAPARGQLSPGSLDYFYPKLELNMTESVLVTQICDPHHVYCQLRSLSKEISRLTDAMIQAFEGARGEDLQEALPTPGSPCAARGIDGHWYRALLLEIYPGGGPEEQPGAVAQVICVDYGRKEFVTKRNLRRLPGECFRMPVVTYLCSLQGITDGGCGWTRSQISELKTLLLGKAVQAKIEAYCAFEHVYYVTFFGEEGFNLNCLFGVQAHCLTQRFVHSHQGYASNLVAEQEGVGAPTKKELLGALATFAAAPLPSVRLKAGECHKAQVSFLKDPTQFSVCLQEYHQPLCHLKQNLQDFYSQSKKLEGILLEPQPGSLCCVMLKENTYHRAVVTGVQGEGIEVYLVDRGNTEIVDLYKVKELLPQFRELPAVALRCALANPSSSQPWSPGSVDYFKKAVMNKELVVQVLGMQGDIYIVELFDHSLAGEKNLAKLMSQGKYAEHHDNADSETIQKLSDKPLRRGTKELGTSQNPVRMISAKNGEFPPRPDRQAPRCTSALTAKMQTVGGICSLPSETVAKEDSSGAPNSSPHLVQNYSEIKPGLSCEGQLEVGSTVDVTVSYVESPSLFWCQLAKTAYDLRVLMAEIQHYCVHVAEPHVWPNPVCLAKYSEDGKWYRALIVRAGRPTEDVEVVYVDYGNKELVSVKDLRSTRTEFLKLKAQAFRCSLYNLIQPDSQDPFVWDEKATDAFQEFVDSASKMELKCTIFALAALNNAYLLNVVDLITPFESACHFLTRKGLARSVEPDKPLTSSVHLLSYYYSTHNIKIGSEELVYVTYINDLRLFYCQLARNAHALERLTNSIGKLSKMGHSLKSLPVPGNLYLAKYTDGCWYRAILAKTSPTEEVFFVDFGNTESLTKEDLILVPRDAYEILLLPMQAIKCSLSDTAGVPKEAIVWFEKAVLDKPLKALIVAKDPDGKLIVELYADKMQINAKMKEDLGLQGSKALDRSAENKDSGSEARRPFFTGVDHSTPEIKRSMSKNLESLSSSRPRALCREVKPFQQKTMPEVMTQSPLPVERLNSTDSVADKSRRYVPLEKREEKADSLRTRNQKETCINSSLKKMCDLPLKNTSPGFKTLVYVSHVKNPSDFYVQLVEDEPLLDSVSEKLNQSETTENLNGQHLHVGDLICAVFPEDGLRYRAVVQKQPSDEGISVQYIDYGNTAVVNICKTCRLLEDCALLPAMAIHCSLGGIKTMGLPEWSEEAMLYFSQSTSEIQMNCEFVEQLAGKWEIILCDGEGNVTADLVNSHLACKKSVLVETSDKNETEVDMIDLAEIISDTPSKAALIQDAKSFFWKSPIVGQTVKAFAGSTESPGYFWCQFADLYEILAIEKKVQDARKPAGCNTADIKIGYCCLAKCNKDENFYRSIVISLEESTLRVAHIDRGTEELVTREMLRQISDELLTLPPQAFPCCLFGFNSSEGSWVEGASDIFCNKVVDSLLDVTVMEILCNRPFEIPLFVVNLECQRENINAQMKLFWEPNTEDGGSAVANILSHEGQNRDAKAEDLEVVLCETGMSASTSVASKYTMASEDYLYASTEDCLASARNEGLCETKGNEYPLEVEEQQTIPETPNNELDFSVPERESDSKRCVLNCSDVSEIQLPASTEVSGQNPFEAQEEVKGQKATLTQDPVEGELPLSSEDSSDSVVLEVPLSSDTRQLLTELEALRTHSFESLVELESMMNHLSCEEIGETSKLGLVEVPLMEGELEQSSSLMDEVDGWLSCGQERLLELPVPATPLLPAAETKELSLLPAPPPPTVPEIQSPLSGSELNPQVPFYMRESTDLCEIGQDAPKLKDRKQQTVSEQSSEQVETRPAACRSFEESDSKLAEEDSVSTLLVGEQPETSSQSAEKNEAPYELKGFDVGSQCMGSTGAHWYEAEILGVSAEGIKVLHDGISTSLPLPESSLAVEGEEYIFTTSVKEEKGGLDNCADFLGLSDQQQ